MSETIVYGHRQIGWAMIAGMLVAIAVVAVVFALVERYGDVRLDFNIVIVVLAVIAAMFSSLTTRITDRAMAWWFGLPMIGRRIPLSEIESISATRTNLMEGWGIHLTIWHGWVWNVSGFNAVHVTLRSGTKFAVGTPEPHAVVAAVERVRAMP